MKIRAAVLHQAQSPLSLETLELEPPRADEVLVRMVATGICHTDIAMMSRPFPVNQPIVLGHEGAGVVEQVGAAVRQLQPGDRVVLSYNACGHCSPCRSRASSYCHYFLGSNFLGQRSDGSTALSQGGQPVRHRFFGQSSFATHSLCTETNAVKVPTDVPDPLFQMLGPLGCGFITGAGAMVNVLKPSMGEAVAVFGSGAVGMAAIMAARALGAHPIIAIDRVATRLQTALELGASHVIDTLKTGDTLAALQAIAPQGVQVTLDTTAASAVLRQALDALAPLGRCGFVGGAPLGTQLEVDVRDVMLKGKTLRGIVEGDAQPHVFIPTLIRMHQAGQFPFDRLVRFYDFEQINQAIADARSGQTIKPIIRFHQGL